MTGLKSISSISGCDARNADSRSRRIRRASRSPAGFPRSPVSALYPRISRIISTASFSESGATRNETSFITSTKIPPRPNITAWPNCGSFVTPTITSCPAGAIAQTSAPPARAPILSSACRIARNAVRTPASSATSRKTPPASLLCVTSGEFIFTATGKPIPLAAAAASSSVPAHRKRVNGNPARARNSIESEGDIPFADGVTPCPTPSTESGKRSRSNRTGEGLHGPLRRGEDGDLLLVEQQPFRALHVGAAEVGHQLAPSGADHFGGAGDRVPEDRHHRVEFPLGRVEHAPVAGGVGVPGEIERVADDAVGGEDLPELPGECGGKRGDAQPFLLGHVGGDDRGPAGARDDQHPWTLGGRDVGEGFREVVQLLARGGAMHAVLAEHGVVDLVASRERPGVRLRRLAPPFGPPGLEDHDGLGAGADGGEEFRRVLHALYVEGDHLRVRILREEIDQVRLVDVRAAPPTPSRSAPRRRSRFARRSRSPPAG